MAEIGPEAVATVAAWDVPDVPLDVVAPSALDDAAELTSLIEAQERHLEELRAARLLSLREAAESVPVAAVAKRLGMSRQRVHKLLRDPS